MNILNYKREEIKKFVQDGICSVNTLRDYDALMAIRTGEKITNVAYDNNISRKQVARIRDKYMYGK